MAFTNAARLSAPPAELVTFAHAALFLPSLSTLCTALDLKHVTGFPGLTSKLVRKYPPQSVATATGHMDQSRKNQRSTKPKFSPPPTDETTTDTFPTSPPSGKRTYHVYVAVTYPDQTGKIFSDQTGCFIIPSSTGSTQLFILYDYDSNHIFAEPMKNKTSASILDAYKIVIRQLQLAGCHPNLQRLDNECSAVLKEYMHDQDIAFQLVPPGTHCRNAAERAIRIFKNHFIAALCSLDKSFPLHLWDRLIPQAVLTLNLLRGSRINPKLSAWAQINGPCDYNSTPIAPPGIRVVAYEPPSQHGSWAAHGKNGWYVGPSFDHYRCYRVWIWNTKRDPSADMYVENMQIGRLTNVHLCAHI
jgi:hypothetical protein